MESVFRGKIIGPPLISRMLGTTVNGYSIARSSQQPPQQRWRWPTSSIGVSNNQQTTLPSNTTNPTVAISGKNNIAPNTSATYLPRPNRPASGHDHHPHIQHQPHQQTEATASGDQQATTPSTMPQNTPATHHPMPHRPTIGLSHLQYHTHLQHHWHQQPVATATDNQQATASSNAPQNPQAEVEQTPQQQDSTGTGQKVNVAALIEYLTQQGFYSGQHPKLDIEAIRQVASS